MREWWTVTVENWLSLLPTLSKYQRRSVCVHVTPSEQHVMLHSHVKARYTPKFLVVNKLLFGLQVIQNYSVSFKENSLVVLDHLISLHLYKEYKVLYSLY